VLGVLAPIVLLVLLRTRGASRSGTMATSLRIMTIGAPRYTDPRYADVAHNPKLHPHERIDATRPFTRLGGDAPRGARLLMGLILLGTIVATAIDLLIALDMSWPAVLALPVLLFAVHRSTFRLVIGAANEPYPKGAMDYPAKFLGEIRAGGLARYFVVGVCLLAIAVALNTWLKIGESLWLGFLIAVIVVDVLGLSSARRLAQRFVTWSRTEYQRKRYWLDDDNRLGGLLGLRQSVLLSKDAVHFDGEDIIVDPVPPEAQAAYSGLQERILLRGEDDYMIAPDSSMKRVHLTPVTDEERNTRDLYRRTNGLVIAERTELYPGTDERPSIVWTLPPTFDEKKMPALQELASSHGYTVVRRDLASSIKTAKVSPVSNIEAAIYARAATLLKINIWDLDMAFVWKELDDGTWRIDQVQVFNVPVAGLTPEKRRETWRALVSAIPDGSDGWKIQDDQQTGVATLRYGEPLRLPENDTTRELVAISDLSSDPMAWARVPYGIKTDGTKLIHYLPSVPHLLVAGKPGTGKSAFARHILATRLALGHQVAIFDHAKKAAFAKGFREYALMWATENRAIANGLAFLREEGARRYTIIRQLGYENWYDLSPKQRLEHGIAPITVFFDELENALDSSGIDVRATAEIYGKDSPQVLAESKKLRAIAFIYKYLAQIGKVDRAAGLYLVVLTQFPYQEILKGIRNPLGMVVQLAATGVTLKSNEVQPALGPDTTEGIELLTKFTTPHDGAKDIVGVGVMQDSVEGGLSPFKTPWLALNDVQPFLDGMGVQTVSPWRFTDQLGIGLRAEETPDHRTPVEPPFGQLLSHKDDDTDEDVVDLFSQAPIVAQGSTTDAASTDNIDLADSTSAEAGPVRSSHRKRIDLFS
jgi:hypothetical protein